MKNRVCSVLGIEYPVVQGAMAWTSMAPLVGAVSEAGGLGVLGCGFMPGEVRELRPADELRVETTITFNDIEMANGAAAGLAEAGLTEVMPTENLPIDSFYQEGESITFSWQNVIESQIAPGLVGGAFSKVMAFFGKLTDFFGAWIPALLNM